METRVRQNVDRLFGSSNEISWLKDIVIKTQLGTITDEDVAKYAEMKQAEGDFIRQAFPDVGFIPATDGEVIVGKLMSQEMLKDGQPATGPESD